jgi:predicted metalloprotease with PDZ domain
LIHELFHLGVPSFYEEGKWFDEGLATYFEPILRARAGMLSELELWREFARGLPLGLHALTRDGLERARGYRGLYWGGALYCLLADIAIRRDSGGRLGLEDGLRRVHSAGGHASEVWPLRRTLETADLAFTRPVLEPLARRHAQQPSPVDLEAIFDELGVVMDGHAVRLDDEAPLAWVRRALLRGAAAVR